jgi:rubrerythrin
MKTFLRLFTIMLFAGIASAGSAAATKSIDDLKAAYNGESTASAKYAAYAEKAKAEGYESVATMFLATSKAEAIHAANHLKVLQKLGEKIDGPQIGKFDVLTTAENLKDAIKGETYEFETMYPGFIKDATSENSNDAVKSFTWAMDTEKRHEAFYTAALKAVTGKTVKDLPVKWFVCPLCGNTFNDKETLAVRCEFCGTIKSSYITF